MRALRAIDEWAVGRGEGTIGDRVAIYGQYVVYLGIAVFTVLAVN